MNKIKVTEQEDIFIKEEKNVIISSSLFNVEVITHRFEVRIVGT